MSRPAPVLAHTRRELAAALADAAPARGAGPRVALVPTMGALHEGHASLVRAARARVPEGRVVVSVFVNPLQFGEGEDLDRYPRTLEEDVRICAAEGVDVVFAPTVDEVYPGGEPQVTIDPGPLAEQLEGRTRPGHFRGVLTVVAKLFGLVRPDVAVFGEKDYQQLALIRRLALDLNLGVEVVGAETVREPDGLALSSRNRFLDEEAREQALTLSAALWAAREGAAYGVDGALGSARAELRRSTGVDLDYLEITGPDLGPLPAEPAPGTTGRVLIAARIGATRLIDNMPITFGSPPAARTGTPPTAPTTAMTSTTSRDGDS
jgi:pantoate--beta-alanine ligase